MAASINMISFHCLEYLCYRLILTVHLIDLITCYLSIHLASSYHCFRLLARLARLLLLLVHVALLPLFLLLGESFGPATVVLGVAVGVSRVGKVVGFVG